MTVRSVLTKPFLDPESGSDFKLDSFTAGPCEGFDTHYGEDGYKGDGDVTKLENLEAFSRYVMEVTNDQGVHFAMADGVSYCHNVITIMGLLVAVGLVVAITIMGLLVSGCRGISGCHGCHYNNVLLII